MPNNSTEENDSIKQKLEYIGLDLNNINDNLKNFTSLDFRPAKFSDEKVYKVYRYLNIQDIDIMLTPTNRMVDISEKYRKGSAISGLLSSKK